MSVRTLEGFVRKSTWQVADVRRPLVSASHIIQAVNDLFIDKDEAYIMSRKKKEKSMLRKELHVYVLDLFVSTTQRDSASLVHAHGSRCNQSSCRRQRVRETSHARLQQLNFLTAGGV